MSAIPIEEVQPHLHDIKCGRGHGSNMHPGNRYYQERVVENSQAYKESRGNFDKNMIAASILDDIQNRSPPGRFLLESNVSNCTERWSIMTDRRTVINKIKQALRDDKKNMKGRKQDSSSASLPVYSNSTSTILSSSVSTSPPSLMLNNDRNYRDYDDAMMNYSQEESKQNEKYINAGWSSAPLPNLNASMPPSLSSVSLPHGYARKDVSSIHGNPCGYYSNSLSTGANVDYQANFVQGYASSIMTEGVRRNSDSLSLSIQSADIELLKESLRSAETRDSLKSMDMEMLTDALRDSLSLQSSEVQLYESLKSVETRNSLTSIDVEILEDAFFE